MGVSFLGFSQESEKEEKGPQGKHELRLDGFEALAFTTIEFNYEYVISKYSGAGAAISFNLNQENIGEYGARGLFVEGSLQFASGEYNDYYYTYNPDTGVSTCGTKNEKWFETGIGLSLS